MDNLTNQWKEAKEEMGQPTQKAEHLIRKGREKKKGILFFHYGNILVLTVTLIVISFFFYYVAPLREDLSKLGIGCMLAGLLIRISIEVYSTQKFKTINLVDNAAQTTFNALSFYKYRKKVHGPITVSTVALYVAGFYLLSPEFSIYINFRWMVIMHLSFVGGAILLVWQIRKGIQKEMEALANLVDLNKEIRSGDTSH